MIKVYTGTPSYQPTQIRHFWHVNSFLANSSLYLLVSCMKIQGAVAPAPLCRRPCVYH